MQRKNHSAEFKAKVALMSLKEDMTLSQLASKYEVHPTMITKWRKHLLANVMGVFLKKSENGANKEKLADELYKQIGQLKVENEWLKKKFDLVIR
ncbi:MAG: hypothetical protein ACD_62C00090G0001 [uncultured bacterium]|nr:MAG: hypothetical protein ACD_62C00090G0001 [uncultured bacterium]HLD43789.1 transposase [bacterium]